MICERERCTGCFACYNVCPKNAIEMKEDEYGYIYPEINKEKCIKCGLCRKICPSLNRIETKLPETAYAMWNKDKNIRENSTSGGAATTFYMHILKHGGVVYGVSNINTGSVQFTRIDNIEELDVLKGSKYVHSYVNDIYHKVKIDLTDGRKVLFIGTPCQIQGLKMYLQKEYNNLITIDLVCHGVPSQKFLKQEIKNLIGRPEVDKVTFRDNDGFNFKLYKDNKVLFNTHSSNSLYYTAFLNGLFYRENCYQCPYAKKERVSDITIGDFWKIDKQKFSKEINKGISLILPITEKGMGLINEIKEYCYLEERSIQEAIDGNKQLSKPSKRHKNNKAFKEIYIKKGYNIAINKAIKKQMIIDKVKKYLSKNKFLKEIYDKIR